MANTDRWRRIHGDLDTEPLQGEFYLDSLVLPIGPGEACTTAIAIDLPSPGKTVLRLRAALSNGRPDSDTIKLACVPAH